MNFTGIQITSHQLPSVDCSSQIRSDRRYGWNLAVDLVVVFSSKPAVQPVPGGFKARAYAMGPSQLRQLLGRLLHESLHDILDQH